MLARVAARGWAATRAARATVSSSTVPAAHDRRARPSSTSSGAWTQSEVNSTCGRTLPAHERREQHAAGGLGRHAQLGEGHAQAGVRVDEDEIAVGEQGEAEADRDAVHRGEERDREIDEAVEQSHETLAGALDGGPGGDGGHFGQVLSGGEGGAPAGEHDGADRLVGVGGAQGGGHLVVHRGVEGVAHLGPVEGDHADAGCGLLDLDSRHERSAVLGVGGRARRPRRRRPRRGAG